VNQAHDGGGTALTLASHANLPEVVERLIALGADVHKKNILGFTPLMMSIDGGNGNIAKMLVEAGALIDDSDNFIGVTSLHLAVYVGDDATIEYLLKHIDGPRKSQFVNAKSDFGMSALHRASSNGHLSTVRLLLAHGADPNLQEGKKRSASILKSMTKAAITKGGVDPNQAGFQSLMLTLFANKTPHDSLKTLGEGSTALHYACREGDVAMVKLLLANKADPRLQIRKSGLNAVDLAIKLHHGSSPTVKALVQHFETEQS
jgi:ankyrin repeat protein